METAYRTNATTPVRQKQDKPKKKNDGNLPEGYISSEEFSSIFEQKLLAAYANL